jgi:hypothetical protein
MGMQHPMFYDRGHCMQFLKELEVQYFLSLIIITIFLNMSSTFLHQLYGEQILFLLHKLYPRCHTEWVQGCQQLLASCMLRLHG